MSSISYEAFLDDSFSPDEWVQVRAFPATHSPFSFTWHFPFSFTNLFRSRFHSFIQTVLEHAASSGSPDTFIQTVLTKLSLLSNDANSSLDVAAHALQVHFVDFAAWC